MTIIDLDQLRVDYLRYEDPTEYYFAIKTMGSWRQWELFCVSNKEYVDDLRRELEAKIRSDALLSIMEASKGSTRDALVANKYLLELPWIKKGSKRGRPTKEEIMLETKKLAEDSKQIADDLNRLNTVK